MNDAKDQGRGTEYASLQKAYAANFEAIKEAHDAIARAMNEDVRGHTKRMGFTFPTMGQLTGEICKDWPMIKQAVNFASMFGAFIPGIGAAFTVVTKLVTVLDVSVIPQMCGTAGGSAPPGQGTR